MRDEILHHQSTDHHRRSRPPSTAEEFQFRLQPSERRHGWWMGSCSDRRELFSDYQRIQRQVAKAAKKVDRERNKDGGAGR